MRRFLWTSIVAAVALGPFTGLNGQPPPPQGMPPGPLEGGGPTEHPRRHEGGPGHDDQSGSNRAADRMARIEGFLQGLDADNNGIIEPNEVSPDRARMLQFFAMRLGLDPSQPIPLTKVRELLAARAAEREGASPANPPGAPGGGQTEKKPDAAAAPEAKAEAPPLVPGFGSNQVPGFGESTPAAAAASAPKTPVYTPAVIPPADRQARIRAFRELRFRRYDRDGNGVIEGEEWSEMRGDPQTLDRNRDGRITVEEFVAGGGESRPSEEMASDGAPSGTEEKPARKSYRFLPPQERLPQGLPGWFVERDRNRDGQVSMAEYASAWSDSTAGEFAALDFNGDGVLTPQECLKTGGAEAKGEEAPSGSPPATGNPPPASGGGDNSGQPKPWWMK